MKLQYNSRFLFKYKSYIHIDIYFIYNHNLLHNLQRARVAQ